MVDELIPNHLTSAELNKLYAFRLVELYLAIAQGKKVQVKDENEESGWYTFENIIPTISASFTENWRVAPEHD